ncbi:ATP-dependent DNA helicase Rep [uncultured archaeon]|nr:ATP-dependent DNA helicase Rep [uncultured archaeon]
MSGLNEHQIKAVMARDGFFNVISVPGSGKTECFCKRARSILDEGCAPRHFLGLTFTKSAAEEMEKRAGYKSGNGKPRIFRTFHGWALDFAQHHHNELGIDRFPLLLPHEKYKILGPIFKEMPRRSLKYREVEEYISQMKRRVKSPADAENEADTEALVNLAEAYYKYERRCKVAGKLDFDSLIVESVKMLEQDEDIKLRVAPRYLQCDEAQDNDTLQWKMIQLITGQSLFVVGDPEQNMYSWRGAEPDGLTTKFVERFPGAQQLVLPVNYRSTGAIIEYCREISPAWNEQGMRGVKWYGELPDFKRYANEDTEAETILMGLTEPDETAVLARTNRQLCAFEKAAGKMDFKYKLLGKSGFFSQHEVESTIAFAQYCAGAATDDTVKKIIRSPFDAVRFVKKNDAIKALEVTKSRQVGNVHYARLLGMNPTGDVEQDRYLRDLAFNLNDCRQQIQGKPSQDALRNVITRFGILNHYQDDPDQIDNNPADNVMALLRMAEKRGTLLEFIQMCHKAKQASRSTAKRLTFSTIHQAKGLEWKHVFVVGVNEGTLPHKNGDPDEEFRIYRVACSRAALKLHISCNDKPSGYIAQKLVGTVVETGQKELDALEIMYRNAATGTSQ